MYSINCLMKIPAFNLILFSLVMMCACSPRIARQYAVNHIPPKPTRIAVISDLNSSYGSVHYNETITKVIKELAIIKPDIILCGGDMVAGQKRTLTEENILQMWKSFKETVLDPIQQLNIPYG